MGFPRFSQRSQYFQHILQRVLKTLRSLRKERKIPEILISDIFYFFLWGRGEGGGVRVEKGGRGGPSFHWEIERGGGFRGGEAQGWEGV